MPVRKEVNYELFIFGYRKQSAFEKQSKLLVTHEKLVLFIKEWKTLEIVFTSKGWLVGYRAGWLAGWLAMIPPISQRQVEYGNCFRMLVKWSVSTRRILVLAEWNKAFDNILTWEIFGMLLAECLKDDDRYWPIQDRSCRIGVASSFSMCKIKSQY